MSTITFNRSELLSDPAKLRAAGDYAKAQREIESAGKWLLENKNTEANLSSNADIVTVGDLPYSGTLGSGELNASVTLDKAHKPVEGLIKESIAADRFNNSGRSVDISFKSDGSISTNINGLNQGFTPGPNGTIIMSAETGE